MEQEKAKSTKENIEKSLSRFEQSLKAHEDWLEKTEVNEEAPLLEVTAVSERENNQELLDAIEVMKPESETEFTSRIESAIKIAEELLKGTQERGKVINSESKENLDPGISSSDEEALTRNLHAHTRKSVTFDPGIALSPDALGKYTPSALRKPKAISTPFPEKLDNDSNFNLSTDKNITRRMGINIPTYSDELTTDTASLPSDHSRPSITGIPPALPKACEMSSGTEMHSIKNVQVRLSSCRENLTFLKSNYLHFLSADCEFVTP